MNRPEWAQDQTTANAGIQTPTFEEVCNRLEELASNVENDLE